MKLLFITQKMDINDDVLGTYHGWVKAFASSCEKVTVICLYKGEVHLPENVKVFSLGKESGASRMTYVKNFYSYILKERNTYDAVFVHMNSIYMRLGGLVWKLLKKKCAFWFNHTYGTWKDKISFGLADIVFHTSPYAFSAGRKNSVQMPAGINTDLFKPNPLISAFPQSIMYVGRLSKVKYVDVLIDAITLLNKRGVECTLDIYGSPDKKEYLEYLKKKAEEGIKNSFISFKGSVANKDMPDIFSAHEVTVNLTPRGNFDKTVLEAMACERISVVSSEAFKDALPQEFMFKEQNSEDLARVLHHIFEFTPEKKKEEGKKSREYIISHHSLDLLVKKCSTLLS